MMLVSDASRGLLLANLRANLLALVHLPGILASRWKIQSSRKVGSSEIEAMLYHEMPPLQRQRFKRLGLIK
jgi:hypothetical protein